MTSRISAFAAFAGLAAFGSIANAGLTTPGSLVVYPVFDNRLYEGGLRNDPRPVDGVDRREPNTVTECVVIEHRFDQRLAVVESAFDCNGMHVGIRHCRHHAALNF